MWLHFENWDFELLDLLNVVQLFGDGVEENCFVFLFGCRVLRLDLLERLRSLGRHFLRNVVEASGQGTSQFVGFLEEGASHSMAFPGLLRLFFVHKTHIIVRNGLESSLLV